MSPVVQVFGRRDDETEDALKRPATKKRQGTKSRAVGYWLAQALWGLHVGAALDGRCERSTRRRAYLHAGEPALAPAQRAGAQRLCALAPMRSADTRRQCLLKGELQT